MSKFIQVSSSNGILLYGFALIFVLIGAIRAQADSPTTNYRQSVCGVVSFISQTGAFKLKPGPPCLLPPHDPDDNFRLWGVSEPVNFERFVELMKHAPLACSILGEVRPRYFYPTYVLSCTIDHLDANEIKGWGGQPIGMNEYLVRIGVATEYCAESSGRYGGCPVQ